VLDNLDEIYSIVSRLTGTKTVLKNTNKKKAILAGLKKIERKLKKIKTEEKKNVKRINEIIKVIMALANLKYDQKALVTGKRTVLDALAVGVNMLGEELKSSTVSLREKETLLKEVHHRVKNNLQVISSLLSLQSEKITQPELLEAFKESRNRISTMALVHEKLYESADLSRIDFTKYMHSLFTQIDTSYNLNPEQVTMHMDVNQLSHSFKIDTAITCGLILNELISNSCKYAFPENRSGNIFLYFNQEKKTERYAQYILQVSDDGVGISPSLDHRNADSLGLQLVDLLTQQLQGTLDLDRTNGTKFTVRFSIENN
jgi:two-component sensor histidine kinase